MAKTNKTLKKPKKPNTEKKTKNKKKQYFQTLWKGGGSSQASLNIVFLVFVFLTFFWFLQSPPCRGSGKMVFVLLVRCVWLTSVQESGPDDACRSAVDAVKSMHMKLKNCTPRGCRSVKKTSSGAFAYTTAWQNSNAVFAYSTLQRKLTQTVVCSTVAKKTKMVSLAFSTIPSYFNLCFCLLDRIELKLKWCFCWKYTWRCCLQCRWIDVKMTLLLVLPCTIHSNNVFACSTVSMKAQMVVWLLVL